MKKKHKHKHGGIGKEFPHTDQLNIILAIAFLLIWFLDTFIFQFSIWLATFIPLLIRIIIFASLLILSFVLGNSSHKILFGGNNEATSLIKNGVFARVRHPLYLSMLLVYLAFALVSMSLICIIFWILMFILYDRMASYEEKDLEKIFSEEYAEYKKRVGKWFPKLLSSKIENSK
ncbi:hypothetical protein ES706_05831 [subsurface metagenome]